jgi:hypothetical protein
MSLVKISRFVLLICFGSLTTIALGQQATQDVTIKVMAKGTGVPLSRAEVKVEGEQQFTGKDGLATIKVPGAGDGNVEIYRNTFETLRVPYQELRTGEGVRELYLFPATPADNEVLIRGAKRPEASRKTVTVQEAARVAPGGDPAQVPKLLPGVQSNSFQPEIVVRGSGPADSRYFIDDFSVPFIFHRIGGISVIPDQLLSDVEFSSGGFGAQYGGATGGVVTLRTKTEIPERATTEFRVNIPVYSSLYHERPLGEEKDAMVAVSIRRSYLETFLPLVLPKDMDLTVVPYFGDAHAYYFKPNDEGHIKVLALYAYDGLKLLFPGENATDESGRGRFDLRDSAVSLGLEWKKNLSKDWSLTTSPQVVTSQNKIDVVGNRIHINATRVGVTSEATKRLSPKERLYVGGTLEWIRGEADVLAPKPDFGDPFFDFEEAPKVETKVTDDYADVAGWTSIDQELGPVIVTPGVRGFYSSQLEESSADPRLNSRWAITEKSSIKAAVGRYSQTPEFRDTNATFGNPDLTFIRSMHYVLGVETNWSERWTTDFQGFYKETKNIVRSDPDTNTNNEGELISRGFEAFIRRNLTERLFGWIAYTYSITEERDSDQETFRNSQYDQTHVLNLVSSYKLTALWELGGRVVHHTGDTYSTVDGAVYNANLDKYQPRTNPGTRVYEGRLPNYNEANIYANRDFLFDTWKMALRFGAEMIAVKPNANGVQYNYDYTDEEYFTTGIPLIPYIEVRGVL